MNKTYRKFSKREETWLKKLDQLMRKAPKTIFMFVGGSRGLEFYTKDENNHRYMTERNSVDGFATNFSISPPFECDGGDY